MDLHTWKRLTDGERDMQCQKLNPYADWDFFKTIEAEFISMYGNQIGIKEVFCGIGGTVGSINAICVSIRRGGRRTMLPQNFLGFPVLRTYERHKSPSGKGC